MKRLLLILISSLASSISFATNPIIGTVQTNATGTQSGAFNISSGTVKDSFRIPYLTPSLCTTVDATGKIISQSCVVGVGAPPIGVSNSGVIVSSPTGNINFSSNFTTNLTGVTTASVDLAPAIYVSSVNFIGPTGLTVSGYQTFPLIHIATTSNNPSMYFGYLAGSGSALNTVSNNTSVGSESMESITGGHENTCVGVQCEDNDTGGFENDAFGFQSLGLNTVGASNSAYGAYSMRNNINGSDNVSIGFSTLRFANSGSQHTAVGFAALENQAGNAGSTAVGYAALNNANSQPNTCVGFQCMSENVSGRLNTCIGYDCLTNDLSDFNTAMGYEAEQLNTTGTNNTAMGTFVLQSNLLSSSNSAVGYQALANATSGPNDAFGYNALAGLTTGTKNVAVGHQAGQAGIAVGTGSGNVFVGYNAQSNSSALNNVIVLGSNAIGTASNTVVLGNANGVVISSPNIKVNGVQYYWPGSHGSSGQSLTEDGAGNLSWATGIGGGGGSSSLQITASGVQVTSPTASMNYGTQFNLSAVGSTSTIALSPNLIVSTITASSATVSTLNVPGGSRAGQIAFRMGPRNQVTNVGAGAVVVWADSTTATLMYNAGGIDSFTVTGTTGTVTAGHTAVFSSQYGIVDAGRYPADPRYALEPATVTIQAASGLVATNLTATSTTTLQYVVSSTFTNVSTVTLTSAYLDVSASTSNVGRLWLNGAAGTSGQVLTSQGSGSLPAWTTVSGGSGGTLPLPPGATNYLQVNTTSVPQNASVRFTSGSVLGSFDAYVDSPTPVASAANFALQGYYRGPISGVGTQIDGVNGYAVQTSIVPDSGADALGGFFECDDVSRGAVQCVGVQGLTFGQGYAPKYNGVLGIAGWKSDLAGGTTSQIVGVEAGVAIYHADGLTPNATGQPVNLLITQRFGGGSPAYAILDISTDTVYLKGPVQFNQEADLLPGASFYISQGGNAYLSWYAPSSYVYANLPQNAVGWVWSNDSQMSQLWDTSATTGAMMTYTDQANWTVAQSTNGTAGQAIYISNQGTYDWGVHIDEPATTNNGWAFVTGLHGSSDTALAVVADDTNNLSVPIKIWQAGTNGNANQNLIEMDAATKWQDGTTLGAFTGNFENYLKSGTSLWKVKSDGSVVSSGTGTFTGGLVTSSITATGLTSGRCLQTGTNGLLTVTAGACASGGGGSSTLAVALGEAAGFSTLISSPVSGIVFDSSTFAGSLTGASTAFISLAPTVTISTLVITGGAVIPATSQDFGKPTLNQWFTSMAANQATPKAGPNNNIVFMAIGDSQMSQNQITGPFIDWLYSNFGNAGNYFPLSDFSEVSNSQRPNGCTYSKSGSWTTNAQNVASIGLDDDQMHTATLGSTILGTCPGADTVILHYAKQPNGGTIQFRVDNGSIITIPTANASIIPSSVTISGLGFGVHTASVSYTATGSAGVDVLDYVFYSTGTPGAVIYNIGALGSNLEYFVGQNETNQEALFGMLPSTPTVAMIEFGVNESKGNQSPSHMVANARQLLTRIRKVYPNIDCAYMSPPDYINSASQTYPFSLYEQAWSSAAVADNCLLVDFTAYFSSEPVFSNYYSDGVHLTKNGGYVAGSIMINEFSNQSGNITPFTVALASNVVTYGNDQSTNTISNITAFGTNITISSGVTNAGAIGNNITLSSSNFFQFGGAVGSGKEMNVNFSTITANSSLITGAAMFSSTLTVTGVSTVNYSSVTIVSTQVPTNFMLQADSATSIVTVSSSPITFSILGGATYYIDCKIIYQSTSTTTGLALSLGTPQNIANVSYNAYIPNAADGTSALYAGWGTSSNDLVKATGTPAINTNQMAQLSGVLRNGSTAGQLVLTFASSVAGTTPITLKAGSLCQLVTGAM